MSTQYHSKEHSSEHEFSKEQKHTKEHFTANQGKTDVVVEKVEIPPVVVEHHHHHTHTVIHPQVVREHDTTEIRQVIKPVYEHIRAGEQEVYGGKEVKFVEKAENTEEAQRKLAEHHRDIQARGDVTHTEDRTTSVDATKVKDVHSTHKVIEEVTPVIIRDVDHTKTIHKDETLVEKIHHAPEVHREELDVQHREGHTGLTEGHHTGLTEGHHTGLKEERLGLNEGHHTGLKEERLGHKEGHAGSILDARIMEGHNRLKEERLGQGHTGHTGLKEGHTKDTHAYKEGVTKEKHRHTKDTHVKEGHKTKGLKEGRIKDTHGHKNKGLKEEHVKETTEIKTKGTPGIKEEHVRDTRIRKGVE